jgi:hypothetical protein
MRRALIGGTATAAALSAAVATALPAVSATRVDGTHFTQAEVVLAKAGCFNPDILPVSPPKADFVRGRDVPMGDRAVGWVMGGTGYGIGPTVHVDDPTTAEAPTISTRFPTKFGQGVAVATFHAADDTGRWYGAVPVAVQQTKEWQEVTASGLSYSWLHYNADGTQDATADPATLSAFAAAHGGDGAGAEVGFMFGCDGSPFFVDDLSVSTMRSTRSWNFEGAASQTALTTPGFRRITFGEKAALRTEVRRTLDDNAAPGRMLLRGRPSGASGYHQVGAAALDDRGRARVVVSPSHTTTFRARYLGTDAVEASTSRPVVIKVATRVHATLADARIVKGHSFVISGRTLSRKAHTVIRLQRYDGKHWSTVRIALTRADGAFDVGTKIARLGKSYWRVIVDKASGNERGKSRWMKVTAVAPPPPPHHGGGGDGGGSTPPPTQPPTDPPPPPPDGPQRPAQR